MRTLLLALALCACSSSKSKDEPSKSPPPSKEAPTAPAGPATYKVMALDGKAPLTVTMATPASWKVVTDPDAPRFEVDGVLHMTFAALLLPMDTAIHMQFGDDSKAERADLSGGRVWMSETQDNGTFHVRLFVPFEGGTLMALAIVSAETPALVPEIRKTFETVTVTP